MMKLKRKLVWLVHLISLKKGRDVTDVTGTIKNVKESLLLKGANLWILVCATFLTCIGLDLDSSTLLIGAMLISPLMNIVLGIGVFQAMNDWENSIRAIRNFTIASLVTFAFSLLYFIIAPYGELTPALMARSKPTLMDAFIACIGAIAGIISFTRKEQLAALPGVAISITLMPPICTIGFALTKSDWSLFFGAFYLFLINAIVIAGSATLIVKLLGFPTVRAITRKQRVMRYNLGIIAVIIFLLPSFYFLRENVSEQKDNEKITRFVENVFQYDSLSSVQWEIIPTDSNKIVKVTLLGKVLPEKSVQMLTDSFNHLGLNKSRLQIIQPNITNDVVHHLAQTIDHIHKKETSTGDSTVNNKAMISEIKKKYNDVKSVSFKPGLEQNQIIAEVTWKRANIFVFGKKQKLREIEAYIKQKSGNAVHVKES